MRGTGVPQCITPHHVQEELAASMWQHGLQPVVAQVAHYGRPQDAPAQPTVFAGQEFRWGWNWFC